MHLGAEADFRPARKAHPGPRVTAVEADAARPASRGAAVTRDDLLPGHRRFCCEDPVGSRPEFLDPV
ncbi:hypothetical protein QFZ75_003179 [Streptomyces sp. V3I8]|nr:hypothetical protein [Streptomyces sp. V3I8]